MWVLWLLKIKDIYIDVVSVLICSCKDCIISCTIFGNCNSNKFKVFILTCVATGFSKSVRIVWIALLELKHCVKKSCLRIFACEVCDELELQLYTCDVSGELALKTTKCAHEMFMVNWPWELQLLTGPENYNCTRGMFMMNWPWELQLYAWDVYDELAPRTTCVEPSFRPCLMKRDARVVRSLP